MQLKCEVCGSTELIKQEGVFKCQSCGMNYALDEVKKMMIEGVVQIEGSVKIDNSAKEANQVELLEQEIETAIEEIGLDKRFYPKVQTDDVNRILQMAREVQKTNANNKYAKCIVRFFSKLHVFSFGVYLENGFDMDEEMIAFADENYRTTRRLLTLYVYLRLRFILGDDRGLGIFRIMTEQLDSDAITRLYRLVDHPKFCMIVDLLITCMVDTYNEIVKKYPKESKYNFKDTDLNDFLDSYQDLLHCSVRFEEEYFEYGLFGKNYILKRKT